MGLFDDEVDGSFDEIFDLDNDGYLDPVERGFQTDVMAGDMGWEDEDDEFSDLYPGLDRDELELMDEDERREAIEDAGYDPDDLEDYFDDTTYVHTSSHVNTTPHPASGSCSDTVAKSQSHPQPEFKPFNSGSSSAETKTVNVSVDNVQMNNVNVSESFVDSEIERQEHRKKIFRNLWIIIFAIFAFDAIAILHGSLTKCAYPGCDDLRTPGSRYCELHREFLEEKGNPKNYDKPSATTEEKTVTEKKTTTSTPKTTTNSYSTKPSSNSKSNTSSSSTKKKKYDSYDVHSYKSAQDFADDKYEEFYDYEDDFEDEDEAYDAAEDYWYDEYDD